MNSLSSRYLAVMIRVEGQASVPRASNFPISFSLNGVSRGAGGFVWNVRV